MNKNSIKILHTADWHLGHRLHGVSRKYEHECFLSWLLEQIELSHADVLIIAGDIFDSANPPASAQSVFYDFLVQARQARQSLDIIIIGGNHDSASRLDAPSQILSSLGIHVIGGLTRMEDGCIDWQRLMIPLTDQHGDIKAICGAMPFIRNADLAHREGSDAKKQKDPLVEGVSELYQQLFEQIQVYKTTLKLDDSVGQIVTGHCYMVGTELSELSERRILGGNQHALPSTIFNKKIDYVALGHLHKAQRVSDVICYSGSPIPLSFSERHYKHQLSQIVIRTEKENKQLHIEAIYIPESVEILSLPERDFATLAELELLLEQCSFAPGSGDNKTYPMLEVKVELDKPEPGLRQKIESMLEGLAVRLLKISIHYPGQQDPLADNKQYARLEELHPEDVFQQCYQRRFAQPAPEKITELFQQLLESVEEQV